MKRSYVKVILRHALMVLAVLVALMAVQGPLLSSAQADLIVNGGFLPIQYIFTTIYAGSTAIPGWTVTQGSVDWNGTYWQAPVPGQGSIDLDGYHQVGGISQVLTTTIGQTYLVTFDLSGNPDGALSSPGTYPGTKTLQVSASGGPYLETFYYTLGGANTRANMLYQPESFVFAATGTSTTLSFTSQDPPGSTFGPVIGNVGPSTGNVSAPAIPLPPALLFFAPGLAAFVGIRRRFKK
jgi:choice-of-anchor C domain-containing protein